MTSLAYRPHIDGLRAVAVLPVLAYHAGLPFVPGGFVGVDIFFVISGFLISALLFREFELHGEISLIGFYERRVRRLAPALLLVLLATLALGTIYLVPIGGEQQGLAKSTIATVLLASNIYFANSTGDYFDSPSEAQPLLHTWSLSLEEQFYLVWPSMLLVVARWASRRGGDPARAATLMLGLTFAVSFLLSVVSTPNHGNFAFYGLPTRAWEFAVGGLVFFLIRSRETPVPFAKPLAISGLMAIAWGVATFSDKTTPFPGWHAAVPACGAAAVILGCEHAQNGLCSRLLAWRPMVFIGLISYSLYLWHWPLLVIARLRSLGDVGPWSITGVCALAFVLAWLTYRYVEDPIRRGHVSLMGSRRLAFLSGIAGSLAIVALAGGLGAWAKMGWTRNSDNAALQTAMASMRKVRLLCGQKSPYEGDLIQGTDCDYPKGGASPDFVVWGDSHAEHLVPALTEYARNNKLSMRVRVMYDCPPLQSFMPELVGLRQFKGCSRFNRDVLHELADMRRNGLKFVVLAAHWTQYDGNQDGVAAAKQGIRQTLEELGSSGIPVVVIAPTPEFTYQVPQCLARRHEIECGLPRERVLTRRVVMLEVMQDAVKSAPGSRIFDPLSVLCVRDRCPGVDKGEILYSDTDHLSVAGSMRLYDTLSTMLADIRIANREATGDVVPNSATETK